MIQKSELFILPIGESATDVVNIELVSQMLPEENKEYSFSCAWIVSNSLSGIASFNGEQVATTDVVFVKAETMVPSVKLTSAQSGKKLFAPGETITLNVNYKNVGDDNSVRASLMFKNANGEYENVSTQNVVDEGEISIALGDTPGSYCILLEIVDALRNTIEKTPYYFVICE